MLKFLNKSLYGNYKSGNKLNILLTSNEIKHVMFYVEKNHDSDPYVHATITFQKDDQYGIKLDYKGNNVDEIIQRVTNDLNKTE